ncbi:MAG: segregation/condensation protein A [Actinomycetales bacterium]|nr:segregation/condensation protein A [Actinomycetales bacterium]
MTVTDAVDEVAHERAATGFTVTLEEFSGPFDLLLQLIARQRLDVTAMALHEVTDEFLAYIRGRGGQWSLDEATYFVLVAATLLDLKAARLIPGGQVDDEEDLALLEARDLLFARLLQYRAFKQVSGTFADMMASTGVMRPRLVGLDPAFQGILPDVVLGVSPEQFAVLAAHAMRPRLVPQVGLGHLHVPRVSVREQAAIIVERLRQSRSSSFRALVSDCDSQLMVVARFLALLELFRDGAVAFDQLTPLGDLRIRWTGSDDADVVISDEFDAEQPVEVRGVHDTLGDGSLPVVPDVEGEDR